MSVGIIINSLAVLFGGLFGGKFGTYLPERMKTALSSICGLSALTMGISFIIKVNSLPPVILAIFVGTAIGELLCLQDNLLKIMQKILPKSLLKDLDKSNILISIGVLSCFSATGIFGAMNAAMNGDNSILYAKSILDLFTMLIFASSLGYVVSLISIPQTVIALLVYYGSILIMPYLNDAMMNDFKACGGIITLAAGLNILKLQNLKIFNMLPALFCVMLLTRFWIF